MLGSCHCKNLIIDWKIRNLSLIARACQCNYCRSKQVHWVSKPGASFSLKVRYLNKYQVNNNGLYLAQFHECLNCQSVVAVSTNIDNKTYGAINLRCLSQSQRFPEEKKVSPEKNQTITERQKMWQQNWCYPVEIITPPQATKLYLVN